MSLNSFRSSHLGLTDNQKRWLVVGIALNKILVSQIRPFVEREVEKEYNNLKTSNKIHSQSSSARLKTWHKFLKYENINNNDLRPKLSGGRWNYSVFDCKVSSHIDFSKLYVENYMAKFNAFDDHCDASAVLTLLGSVPVFSSVVRTAAGVVKGRVRNDWAHCMFSKWDVAKFQEVFADMADLVQKLGLPAADEAKLLGELNDWETKGKRTNNHSKLFNHLKGNMTKSFYCFLSASRPMKSQVNIKSAKLMIQLTTKLCGIYEWFWHLRKTKHMKSLVFRCFCLLFPFFVSHPHLFLFKRDLVYRL